MKHSLAAVCLAALLIAGAMPAVAHHPGAELDSVMAGKEPAFEPTDVRRAPQLAVTGPVGESPDLSQLADRIVVLSFVPDGCGAPCADQQALLQGVQEAVNMTPMRGMVLFVTLSDADKPDPGWQAENWRLVPADGSVAQASNDFAALSRRRSDAPMAHVIDRGGRHAAVLHGAGFERMNMVIYINGLTNAPPPEPELLDRILGTFR
jgi:hypothetical protein